MTQLSEASLVNINHVIGMLHRVKFQLKGKGEKHLALDIKLAIDRLEWEKDGHGIKIEVVNAIH